MTDRTAPAAPQESRSTATLLSDAMTHVSGLIRKEIDLTRAELNENARKAGIGIGMIVAAVVVVLTALNVLSAALVAAVTELGIEPGWSALIVGGAFLLIAAIMMKRGMDSLKAVSLAPTRSARSVQRDAHAIKESING